MTSIPQGKPRKKSIVDTHPHLASEYSPNNSRPVESITHGSNVKVEWICSAKSSHVWSAVVGSRALGGCGCPVCSGRIPEVGINDLTSTHPDLARQWHPSNTKSTFEVSAGAHFSALWVCDKDSRHVWNSTVKNRVSGNGCSVCTNRTVISGVNDLATTHPELAAEWCEGNGKSSSEVSYGSDYRATWVCKQFSTHTWSTPVCSRTYTGCPVCSNQQVLAGFNDILTLDPDLCAESDDATVDFSRVTRYSSLKVRWKCIKGHTWVATIADRSTGRGCKRCCNNQTSKVETSLRDAMSDFNSIDVIGNHNHKLDIPWRKNTYMEVDIFVTRSDGKEVVVEYDGGRWHNRDEAVLRDVDKTQALLDRGYTVVRVREGNLPFVNLAHDRLFQITHKFDQTGRNVQDLAYKVFNMIREMN